MRRGERLERSRQVAEVNALVPTVAAESARRDGQWLFLCECGFAGCDKRVLLTLRQYGALRAAGTRCSQGGTT